MKTYKNAQNWKCEYCGCIVQGRRSYFEHKKTCEKRLEQGLDSLGRSLHKKETCFCDFCGRTFNHKESKTQHMRYCGLNPNREIKKGHTHTPETRAKLAEMMRKRHNLGNYCNYNENACKFIDELNAKYGWHLQHAMNDGDVCVGPYHLDGYDKELNVAFEYDEKKSYHNSVKGKMKDKAREDYIKSRLHCIFVRYDERTNTLLWH